MRLGHGSPLTVITRRVTSSEACIKSRGKVYFSEYVPNAVRYRPVFPYGFRVADDDDDDIDLRPEGASETDCLRPPEGYRDVLSWGIIYSPPLINCQSRCG